MNAVKSPSDTTLYAPALKHTSQESRQGENLIQQISEFVDEIQLASSKDNTPQHLARKDNKDRTNQRSPAEIRDTLERGIRQADKEIIEAERFNTNVEPPSGKDMISNVVDRQYNLEDDEDFFHLACHVDGATKSKIE